MPCLDVMTPECDLRLVTTGGRGIAQEWARLDDRSYTTLRDRDLWRMSCGGAVHIVGESRQSVLNVIAELAHENRTGLGLGRNVDAGLAEVSRDDGDTDLHADGGTCFMGIAPQVPTGLFAVRAW